MKSINKKVRLNYLTYQHLIKAAKTLARDCVDISTHSTNNVDYRKGDCGFVTVTSESGLLYVKRRVDEESQYDFVLRVESFTETSLCRFDSDGHTHVHKDPDLPVSRLYVTTPHFHVWNEKGKEVAYKTTQLSSLEKEIHEDINVGFSLFCEEFNINSNSGVAAKIITWYSLFPELSVADLHSGVNFE